MHNPFVPPSKLVLEEWRVGVHHSHEATFTIDRPVGSGDYLFLRFDSPTRVRDRHGEHQTGAGTCLLYSPGMPQWYQGLHNGLHNEYSDSWMHFRATGFDLWPTDELFVPQRLEFVIPLMLEIERETARREANWREISHSLTMRLLFLLARAHPSNTAGSQNPSQDDQLSTLRAEMQAHPEALWTVEKMARRVHLSSSRFAVLYREKFGLPPIDDVIEARLAKARYLLLNQSVSVAFVARSCGFASPYYFSRLFKSKTGCAPRDYYSEKMRESNASPRVEA